uniref:Uncharacterized protein n=1 Tax=Octopus bimaculoides TaxID=37653 RepID=A0A0L8G5Z0_OCTBM
MRIIIIYSPFILYCIVFYGFLKPKQTSVSSARIRTHDDLLGRGMHNSDQINASYQEGPPDSCWFRLALS